MRRTVLLALVLGACGDDESRSRGAQSVVDAAPVLPIVDAVASPAAAIVDAAPFEPAPEIEEPALPDAGTPTAPCDGARCPTAVRPDHLQLWLRADVGVACTGQVDAGGGRARRWLDLSGHGRHATAPRGKLGPVCASGADPWGGRPVLSFGTDDNPDVEQLEVDLGFLVARPFTIAVVEHRRAKPFLSFFVGSKLPVPGAAACDLPNPNAGQAITFGWETPSWIRGSTWGPLCDAHLVAGAAREAPLVDWLVHTPGQGLVVHASSIAERGVGANAPALSAIGTGLIGRGWLRNGPAGDSRFRGDLAELIFYDDALGDDERATLEAYFHETWGAMR